jgi:tetratricopeptide (TPR) repeat protein
MNINRVPGFVLTIAAISAALLCQPSLAQGDPGMAPRQARKVIVDRLQSLRSKKGYADRIVYTSPAIDLSQQEKLEQIVAFPDRFQFLDKGKEWRLIGTGPAYSEMRVYKYKNLRMTSLRPKDKKVTVETEDRSAPKVDFFWDQAEDAHAFAEALNILISDSRGGGENNARSQFEMFARRAYEWRHLDVKPPLPEEARRKKLLAEDSVQAKEFERALAYYQDGLDLFPLWPEGQFNTALLCGETEDYACAIQHMRFYLELVPDAPDAQAARDKIIIWEEKSKR